MQLSPEQSWAILFGAIALIAQFLPAKIGLPLGFALVVLATWQLWSVQQLNWQASAVIVMLTGVLVYRLYRESTKKSTKQAVKTEVIRQYQRILKKRLTARDIINVFEFTEYMLEKHGHDDEEQLKRDLLDGYSWSEIRTMECSRCQKPRNEKGGEIYE
jgi:membrane protein implicated in regulation of membrane protease activity